MTALLLQTDDPALQDTTCTKEDIVRTPQVHFNSSVRCVEFEKADVPANKLWYAPADFRDFKDCFAEDAKKVARKAKTSSGNQAVVFLFGMCVKKKLKPLDERFREALHRFANKPSNRGLENFCDRKVFQDKHKRREMHWEAVKVAQEQNLDEEDIALACSRCSVVSVLMAQLLAQSWAFWAGGVQRGDDVQNCHSF